VLQYPELLQSARKREEQELNATPCIIVGDEAGLFKPEVVLFPIIEVLPSQCSGQKRSRTASAALVERVHTLPILDWDAPAGRSPFVHGLKRAEDVAREMREKEEREAMAHAVKAGHVQQARMAQLLEHQAAKKAAAASASRAVPLPAPKLLWCEVCRKHCESEQTHHNTPEHQRAFDSYEAQVRPLAEELELQRKWHARNHFMQILLRKARGKPLPGDEEALAKVRRTKEHLQQPNDCIFASCASSPLA
jgi:hypothetical protein